MLVFKVLLLASIPVQLHVLAKDEKNSNFEVMDRWDQSVLETRKQGINHASLMEILSTFATKNAILSLFMTGLWSCELSFSALRGLWTWPRVSINEAGLNVLESTHIRRDHPLVKQLKLIFSKYAIVQILDASMFRRIDLAFDSWAFWNLSKVTYSEIWNVIWNENYLITPRMSNPQGILNFSCFLCFLKLMEEEVCGKWWGLIQTKWFSYWSIYFSFLLSLPFTRILKQWKRIDEICQKWKCRCT